MPKFNLIDPKEITQENLPRIVGTLLKQLDHLFNYLDDVNIRPTGVSNKSVKDVDGVKLYPLSVADGKVSDVNGGKLHTLSVATNKHKAGAITWDKVDNSRVTNSSSFSLAASETKAIYVEHATIYSFAGPPFMRASGDSAGTFIYPVSPTALTYYSSNVELNIRWYTAIGFMYVVTNLSASPISGGFDWYRDGILNNGVS